MLKVNKKILLISLMSILVGLVLFGSIRSTSVIKANDTDSSSQTNETSAASNQLANAEEPVDLNAQNASVKNHVVPFSALPTPTKEADVPTWAALITALSDTTIDRINITADFTSGAALPAVNRELVINGNNHVIGFGARYFNIGATGKITISDLEYTGTNYLASGSGTLVLTNKISSSAGNASVLANMNGATVIFDNVDLYFDSTSSTGAVAAKNFSITNQSKVDSNSERFYQITAASNAGATFTVDKQSKVLLSSMKGTGTGNHGQPIQSTRQLDMTVEGAGTELKIRGNGKQNVDYTGLINIDANASNVNVINEALLDIYTENTSGINMQSLGGTFNVKNKSLLNIHQTGDNNYARAAMVRFRAVGNTQFNIEGQSEIKMTKDSGSAPGIRMYGGGNSINVSGGSDFTLVNKGSGTPIDPGGNGGNQGILYTNSGANPDSFVVKDEDSSVDIQAANGAAIDAKGLDMTMTASSGTYFVARGQTRTATSGIFNAGVLTSNFESLKYFDFVNTRPGGGLVFDTSAGSTFKSLNSDLSVWVAGVNDATGNPMRSFVLANVALAGANFGTIDTGTDSEVIAGFNQDGGMPKYTRLNGNNQNAIVDELRVPTDADKYIWGHVGIPEGKHDNNRNAFTGEVSVIVGVYDVNDTLLYKTTGTIVEDAAGSSKASVYGDDARGGLFKLDTQPKGNLLEKGQKLKVLEAWRGDKTSGKAHISEANDLIAPERTVLDVTPPLPTKLTDTKLDNATKVLSGTGAEAGASVRVYYDSGDKETGTLLGSTTVGADGAWSFNLPKYVEKTKELSVYLEDHAGQHTAAQLIPSDPTDPNSEKVYDQIGLIKPPVTNVAAGNINPYNDLAYHDAIFKGVAKYVVADVIPTATLKKEAATYRNGVIVDNTQVGDTVLYTLTAMNSKEATYTTNWKNIIISDVLPAELVFDATKAEVTIAGVLAQPSQYSYENGVLSFNAGDLKTQESVKVTFKVTVGDSAVDKEIFNEGTVTGDSPREAPFVAGPNEPNATFEQITAKSEKVGLAGGKVFGVLSLSSAPTTIDFGLKKTGSYGQFSAEKPVYDQALVVSDSRASITDWELTAKVTKVMESADDPSYKLPEAIVYKKGSTESVLRLDEPNVIADSADLSAGRGSYDVSEEEWQKKGNGFKMELAPTQYRKLGEYTATIEFTLSAVR
ncbi:pectate lyase-like adhesive domain-containing protein [Enterococcus sp. AZ101]|uniref:pectate lyase-like adhesive domain-containing protein n=1 Tax=Enterococcus sp. AZ101 TaxID=2774742 RepID=UPI003D2779D3